MKIEAGKRYLTRDGELIGPLVWDHRIGVWRRDAGPSWAAGDYWHQNGLWHGYTESDRDICEEISA